MNLIKRAPRDKEHPYVQVSKQPLDDKALSLSGKGLLVFILSKPDDWQVYVDALAKELKESKNTVARYINELIERRYCVRTLRSRGTGGTFSGYDYIFFETLEQREEWGNEHA